MAQFSWLICSVSLGILLWQLYLSPFSIALEQVVKLIVSQSHTSQDALVAQAKAFVESTLVAYVLFILF